MGENPATRIKPPKKQNVERQAYAPDVIDALRRAQPALRDQIAVRLLGLLALRKNELRLLKVSDFDLAKGTFRVHGKGGKVAVMPIALEDLKSDLELHLIDRNEDEYLLYPRSDPTRPRDRPARTDGSSVVWNERELPTAIKTHELRHSAADNFWRSTGNLMLAQQLLRHESVATTQSYLHPTRDDLEDALARQQVVRSEEGETAWRGALSSRTHDNGRYVK